MKAIRIKMTENKKPSELDVQGQSTGRKVYEYNVEHGMTARF